VELPAGADRGADPDVSVERESARSRTLALAGPVRSFLTVANASVTRRLAPRGDPGAQPAHPAVAQQVHVINGVRPATIPATTEATFNPAFAPLSARDTQMLISQPGKAGAWCQSQHRDQPGRRHEIRVVEHR